jgi:sigma-B regulation protein RsbU (phosphoserine phosphatase)
VAKPDALTLPAPSAALEEQRLVEICALLERAGAGPFRAIRDELSGTPGRLPLLSGWALGGGGDEAQRRAAVEVVRGLYRAEDEIRSLSVEILDRYEETTLIYRLSQRLGTVLGEAALAHLVVENAADLLGARSAEIWLRDEDEIHLSAAVPEKRSLPCDPHAEIARAALEEGKIWTRDAGAGVEALAVVPLPDPGKRPIGVLVLRGRAEGRSYRSVEVKLLQTLASLTSAFLRNTRLAAAARKAEARKREDEIAREIHRSLLPARDPECPGLDVAGVCRAADVVGGDYYGYIPLSDGSILLALADASGHGVGAALYMAAAKGALQAQAGWVSSPAELLRRTNESLANEFARSGMFATAFVARFRAGGRSLEFTNAGHNPPLLVRAGGEVELLEASGTALGLLGDASYEEGRRSFGPGDLLVVYTDGLTEARDAGRRFYKLDRLIQFAREVRGEPAATIRARLLEDLARHCGDRSPQDDVTLIVVSGLADDGNNGR